MTTRKFTPICGCLLKHADPALASPRCSSLSWGSVVAFVQGSISGPNFKVKFDRHLRIYFHNLIDNDCLFDSALDQPRRGPFSIVCCFFKDLQLLLRCRKSKSVHRSFNRTTSVSRKAFSRNINIVTQKLPRICLLRKKFQNFRISPQMTREKTIARSRKWAKLCSLQRAPHLCWRVTKRCAMPKQLFSKKLWMSHWRIKRPKTSRRTI